MSCYYDRARDLLHHFEFESDIHKKIWELHCEGLSKRKIAAIIQIYKRETVGNIIKKIAGTLK